MADDRLAEVLAAACEDAADTARDWTQDYVRQRLGACESPIEELFLAGFAYYGAMNPEDYQLDQQVAHGRYRLDFVVTMGAGTKWEQRVGVECDGHDYHERTKEQARRDKRRDREMTRAGLPVLRFTGSELWRDARGCAEEVVDFLQRNL